MPGEMDLSQMLGLGDKPVRIVFDRMGQVVKTEGLEEIAGGMQGGMMNTPEQYDYPFFPDKPVDIGETWQHQDETSLPGSPAKGKRTRNYVLRGVREVNGMQVAIIGVKEKTVITDATSAMKAPMGGDMEMTQHIKSMTVEHDGEMLLDIVQGRVLDAQGILNIDQDISISGAGQGQQINVKTQMDLNATFGYDYGDQETPDLSALYTKREKSTRSKAEAEVSEAAPQPAQIDAQVDQVKSDMRTLRTALETFFIDNNTYPLALEGRTIGEAGIKLGEGADARIVRLTKPVTYIKALPTDPFNPDGNTYRYFSDGKSYWVLVSDGPDQKADYDEREYKGERLSELKEHVYDRASGEKGSGDIIRVGP